MPQAMRILHKNPATYTLLRETASHYIAIQYLRRSIEADANDGQTWYLLGRCFINQQKYRLAYDAYQQAVYVPLCNDDDDDDDNDTNDTNDLIISA